MKRFCLLCIPLLLLAVQARAYDFEADDANGNRLFYTISDKTNYYVKIVSELGGDTSYSGDIVIPEKVTNDGTEYTVTAIDAGAFINGASLTSVTIPSTITSIGNYAFENCTSLATVNFNATTCSDFSSTASYDPFYGCSAIKTVTIGASVKQIPAYFLRGISSLTTLTIADDSQLTSIGTYAFYNCSSLESSITVPDGVTSIGTYTFYGCSSLPSVTLPDSLTSIGTYAFYNCSSLASSITVPSGVTTINNYTFYGCSSLPSVTLPDNLTSIGTYAFDGCSSLKSINIPSGVTTIETSTFYDCSSLSSITLPEDLTSIGQYAFYNCSSLTELTIPEKVTSIGNYSFQNCTSLAMLNFDATECANFATISSYDPFYGCTVLTTVTISANVTQIPAGFLYGISSLQTLTIPDDSQLTSIGAYAFDGCSLIESINIPDGVESIGNSAFYGCSSLTSITLPDNLTSIGSTAFYNCTALTEITIPEKVTSIDTSAFEYCSSLVTVNFNAAECADFSYNSYSKNNPFTNCTALTTVNVGAKVTRIPNYLFISAPVTSVTFADNSELTTIATYAFGSCNSLTEITIPEGVTTIGNYAFQSCTKLATVTFAENSQLTTIGTYAFASCSALTEITIPAGVTSMGTYAFTSCSLLRAVIFPENSAITTIPEAAFYICPALTEINIPDSVTTIGNYAFQSCTKLATVTFAENSALKTIGNYAFYSCSALTEITIPEGVTNIGSYVFTSCSSLKEITISEGVTSIGEDAFQSCTSLTTLNFNATECADFSSTNKYQPFYGCSKLATVNIGANVKQIPAYFLYGITSLTRVVIPDGTEESTETSVLETIGADAFYNCSALESLCTIPATCQTIGEDALYNVPISALCFAEGAVYSTDQYALYNSDKTELIVYYAKNTLEEYTIPASVVTIDDTAFEGSTYLKTLLFEDESKLDTIGANAFNGCTALTAITIPASCKVVSDQAFYGCTSLATVTFEEVSQLDSIGTYAFYNCKVLTEITIPEGVTTIGNYAFQSCTKLATVTFAENSQLTTIGTYAFASCSALTEITIPAGVTSMGTYAFSSCSLLRAVIFPENSAITTIPEAAFYNCPALTEINIPDSVTTIGISAFQGCTSLTEITIPENVTSVGRSTFYNCTSLATVHFNATECADFSYNASSKYYYYQQFYNCTALTTVTIGANVTTIPTYFLRCDGYTAPVKWVVIPDGTEEGTEKSVLTSIGNYAFYNCSAIEYFCTIPATCESIGSNALYNVPLKGLCFEEGGSYQTDGRALYNGDETELIYYYTPDTSEDYEILSTATSIDASAFNGCTYLKTVTFGEGTEIKSIDASAFYYCTSLESITIPESVTSIGQYAFGYCSALTEITIPDSVTSIGQRAFERCTTLTEITIPEKVTSVGMGAFMYCTSLATVHFNATECGTFTDTYNGINSSHYYQQFDNCTALTTVTIGANVEQIPAYFLHSVTSLETVTFGEDSELTSMGNYAFYNCTSLAEISLPDSLTSIGSQAFYNCTSLATVMFGENPKLKTINSNAFQNCTALTEITIPEKVTSVGNYAFQGCTLLATLHFNAVACGNFSSTYSHHPFYNCPALKTATIGASVTTIPQYLFYENSVLETVTFDENSVLETTGSYSFYDCSKLAALDLPSSITAINQYALYNCSGIKEITIPSGVTSIGSEAFYNCTSLTTLNFNAKNCTTMGTQEESAIYGCTALSTVNIADDVEYLPSYFLIGTRNDYFPALTSLVIPDGVTQIGAYALYDVNLLDSLTIGANVTSIGANAFTHCTDLKTIICNAQTPPTCGTQAFYQIADDAWLVVPEGYSQNYTTEGTVQAIKATQTGWSDIANMREATVSFPMRTTEGYATHYSPYEYTLDDNLEATTIVDADTDGKLTMYWEFGHGTYTDENGIEKDQTPTVPAGVAVLLHEVVPNDEENKSNIENDGEQSYANYSNTTVNWEDEEAPENMLYGSKVATTTTVGDDGDDDDYYFYKFAYSYKRYTDDAGNVTHSEDGVLGFYWGDEETGGTFQISANLAWLAIPKTTVDGEDGDGTGAKLYGYPLVDGDGNDLYGNNHNGNDIDGADGQTTQIDGVDADENAGSGTDIIYNMAGQRVNDMSRRGVYIVNGRKVAVK